MKLPDALRGVRQLAFDTAPLIYFVQRHPIYFERMLFIMRYVDAALIDGYMTLAERYEAIVSNSHSFRLEPTTTAVARSAANLRARYNLRTPDALHVATALAVQCDAFLTNDCDRARSVR
jgi:predicted nucleic acid-binding protein